ncbi:MAG TPA: NADPH:quinone reductase [Variovorax sp.]|nr:NADPH:quinone reductase [Variovorax sp.]
MLAAIYEHLGTAADVLRVVEIPDPHPGPGEVRVRIRWSGINPSDVKSREGRGTTALPYPFVVPHSDGMGVIDEIGEGVAPGRIGQRVWIWNAAWNARGGRQFGTAAQYVVLLAAQAVALPDRVSDEAGAFLGIPAMTALHALLLAGGVRDRRVLVSGGAGAVGRYAIQFARLLGARQVLATASTADKHAVARAAGAEVVVDHRAPDAAARLRGASDGGGVDRVIELDIAANVALDLQVLAHQGEIVVYGSSDPTFQMPYRPALERGLSLCFFLVYTLDPQARKQAMDVLDGFLARSDIDHAIAQRWPLAQIVQAHEAVEHKRLSGNVVLAIP